MEKDKSLVLNAWSAYIQKDIMNLARLALERSPFEIPRTDYFNIKKVGFQTNKPLNWHDGRYTGLGRCPYGGRHLGSCPPSGPQFQARGWTSTTFAHCKLIYFIFIIAYDCFINPSSTKLYIFLYFYLHNVLLIFS